MRERYQIPVGAVYEGVNELESSNTPLLEKGINILNAGSGEATPLLI
jgi:hypothetical protein